MGIEQEKHVIMKLNFNIYTFLVGKVSRHVKPGKSQNNQRVIEE